MIGISYLKQNRLLSLVAFIYLLLAILAPAEGLQSLMNSLYYLKEMLQVLPVIFLLTAVIEAWVPKETIVRRLGDSSGAAGALLSLALGSISVGPIYAAFPISKMLIAKGASIGNIVIILSSWAVIKLPMLANEAKFLGVTFMVARWFLTVVAIFGMAQLVSKLVSRSDVQDNAESTLSTAVLTVNEHYCVGCGLCVRLLPDLFGMKHNKAVVLSQVVAGDPNTSELIEKCPTRAISLQDSSAHRHLDRGVLQQKA